MQEIHEFSALLEQIHQTPCLLVYGMSPLCIVCQDTAPLVAAVSEEFGVPAVSVNLDEVPLARGQLHLFTAPVLLLFVEGKEVLRQGRFLDWPALKKALRIYSA